jgi:hypothetical protein
MEKNDSNPITLKSQELFDYISTLDKSKFIPLFVFFLKADRETPHHFLNLTSTVQQILYVLKLLLNSSNGTNESIDFPKVESLLEEIETLYKERYAEVQLDSYYDINYRKSLAVSGTFLNYFTNSSLIYTEQIISRIIETYKPLETYIVQQTGLSISDYIDIFLETRTIVRNNFQRGYDKFELQQLIKNEDGITCYSQEKELFLPYTLPSEIAFLKSDYQHTNPDKLDKFLSFFSSEIGDSDNIYYCTQNVLWAKPIITLDRKHYFLPFDPQLAISIYYFLLTICNSKSPDRVSKLRSNYLEDKAKRTFEYYFKDLSYRIFTNYYVNYGECEKDILIICNNLALVIECKSQKYKEPLGDFDLAFEKIKRDFKSSIQDAYRQSKEVDELFYSNEDIIISDKNKNKRESISTKKIDKIYSIIVTQERFGQIQCDLGLLLDKDENDFYPWCVSIDDLESILLTFKRKENQIATLEKYLFQREKLHERLICFDELDIASYYLLKREDFINACNSDQLFVTSPDMCEFFDSLYRSGFGFENEIDMQQKFNLSISSYITYAMCKKIKLQTPQIIAEYKKANGINDAFLKQLEKMITHYPDSKETKEFIKLLGNKSIPLQDLITLLK